MTRRPRITNRSRRGFSFTEVLFAVMILGIGFIMVAAIFPVAMQQARTSAEETAGATISRGAANVLEKAATNSAMPATGLANIVVCSDFDGFPPPVGLPATLDGFTLSSAIRGNVIIPADPRYGWVPFYRRSGDPLLPDSWSPFAQVIMVPVFARAQSEFYVQRQQNGQIDDRGVPKIIHDGTGRAVIHASIYDSTVLPPGTTSDQIVFLDHQDVPSEGAYVIIADVTRGRTNDPWPIIGSQMHGRIYRLGNRLPMANPAQLPTTWELMPGFDFDPIRIDTNPNLFPPPRDGAPPNPNDGKDRLMGSSKSDLENILVFVVGRGVDRNAPSGIVRDGTAQDVAAYTTFVNVK